jgi:hypothetical protein
LRFGAGRFFGFGAGRRALALAAGFFRFGAGRAFFTDFLGFFLVRAGIAEASTAGRHGPLLRKKSVAR